MAEGLQLQGRVHPAADLPYLVHPQLPGQHHSLGPQVKPRLGAGIVGDGLLGADVPLAPGGKMCIRDSAGAVLRLGDGYLQNLSQDVIFRTPGLRPDVYKRQDII